MTTKRISDKPNKGKKTYSGINIQWPISELILSGEKTIETRTYPIPEKYINQDMILIETPGKKGKFKARMRGIIVFTECFKYKNKREFYKDSDKTCVTPESDWEYDVTKGKWGWRVLVKQEFDTPRPLKKRSGIVYSNGIEI